MKRPSRQHTGRIRDAKVRLITAPETFTTLPEFYKAIGIDDYDEDTQAMITSFLMERSGPNDTISYGLWEHEGVYHADPLQIPKWKHNHEKLVKLARRAYLKIHHPTDTGTPPLILTPEQRADLDAFHAETAAERERRRAERIAARPEPPVIETRKCEQCGKKPARLGNLCKRCAHAAGVMPKGKIGDLA